MAQYQYLVWNIYIQGAGKPTIAPVFCSGRSYLRIIEALMLLHRKMLENLSRRLGVCVFHGVGGNGWECARLSEVQAD